MSRIHARIPPGTAAVWFPLLLLLAVFGVYMPGIGGGFVFDDYPNIVDNPAVRVATLEWGSWISAILSSPASAIQRPLAMATFAANHYFTGLDPMPMKLTNIAIHAINALLAYGLLTRLFRALPTHSGDTGAKAVAMFVAATWALNPINVTGVLFIVQRMESLSHTLVFLGLWLYVDGRMRLDTDPRKGWGSILAGVALCSGIGVLAKESAVLLPLYAALVELFVFRFRGSATTGRQLEMLFLVVLVLPAIAAIAYLLPQALAQDAFAGRTFTLAERLFTEPRVLVSYLRWTVFPDLRSLGLYHDDFPVSHAFGDPRTLAALAAMAVLVSLACLLRHRRPLTSLGIAWFFAAHVLTATFLPLELVFEHRNYFASLGVCLAAGDLLLRMPEHPSGRRLGAVAAIAFLVFCAGTTLLRAMEWSDPVRFARSEARKHPESARATYDYARALIIVSGYKPDAQLRAAIVEALASARQAEGSSTLPEQATLIFNARAGTAIDPEVWSSLDTKLRRRRLGPQDHMALITITNCVLEGLCNFEPGRMLDMFGAALSSGEDADVMTTYGNYSLRVLGDRDLALRLFHRAVVLAPATAQYRVNLVKLQITLGQYAQAREQIANLRELGKMGQFSVIANQLSAQLPHPPVTRSSP